ncbi:hypothetical protein HXX76_010690 [Chlamydomonas incerta]|uniref:Uncharacterized protein n=1 Tax=Chlamydomonas incerta TaxID=51695 RepID=A0A835VVY2_CHLIN|nr:hypothetical protein HXX76_010690 [Chlamydomonas incerta]|eukprot:KAG2429910.1 hypothetical protein HXX76_010690 [Chlamydomonas incerta]
MPPLQVLQLLLLAAPLLYAALFVSRERRTRRALAALRKCESGPRSASAAEPSGVVDGNGGAGGGNSSQAAVTAAPAARANASARPAGGADGGGAVTAAVAVGHADGGSGGEDGYAQEPELLRWRRFDPCTYMPGLPLRWRLLLGLFRHFVVCRPSNDASLGLQGWREGRLARWDLAFPVLTVFDRPGQAVPGEGFHEWPLFDIFKIPLSGLGGSWHQYLSRGLPHAERHKVRQRTRLYASFESCGLLHCEVLGLGPQQQPQQGQEQEEQQQQQEEQTTPPPLAAVAAAAGAATEAAAVESASGGDGGGGSTAAAASVPGTGGGSSCGSLSSSFTLSSTRTTAGSSSEGLLPGSASASFAAARADSGAAELPTGSSSASCGSSAVATAGAAAALNFNTKLQQQQQRSAQASGSSSSSTRRKAASGSGAAGRGGATARATNDNDAVARALRPPRVSGGAPGSAAARALVSELWALYKATGRRNGFTEVTRQQFTQLLEEAPGVQVIVIREGSRPTCPTPAAGAATSAPSPTSSSPPAPPAPAPPAGAPASAPPTRPGRVLAFGVVLPQRESLQLLYAGLRYGSPLVRQSNAYFQIVFVALQLALDHNSGCGSSGGGGSSSKCDAMGAEAAAGGAAEAVGPASPFSSACAPLQQQLQPFAWLDLGPGHRFVKTHLGAAPHPLVLYARGIGPLSHTLAGRLLGARLDARKLLTDP